MRVNARRCFGFIGILSGTFYAALCICFGFLLFGFTACGGEQKTASSKEFTGLQLSEAARPESWQPYFPEQYDEWESTRNILRTTFGGSGDEGKKIDYLREYPFLKTIYNGFGFAVDYYRSRGHYHALQDVKDIQRVPDWDARSASCLACKSSDVPVYLQEIGDDFYAKSFAQVVGENSISCLDCHSHKDASVTMQRDFLLIGLESNPWIDREARINEMTCAQCHVNYYFAPGNNKVTLSWSRGLSAEKQLAHNDERGVGEYYHADTGAFIAKVQHPEFEFLHGGAEKSIHSEIGLGCTDCHMPATEAGHAFHGWVSPLTHVEESCFACHGGVGAERIVRQVETVQSKVYEKQISVGRLLERFIIDFARSIDNGKLTEEQKRDLQGLQREAHFYWDFVFVENSTGFHNWKEAHRLLDKAEQLIKEGLEGLEL